MVLDFKVNARLVVGTTINFFLPFHCLEKPLAAYAKNGFASRLLRIALLILMAAGRWLFDFEDAGEGAVAGEDA